MYVIPSASMRRRTSFTRSARPSAPTKRSRSVAPYSSFSPALSCRSLIQRLALRPMSNQEAEQLTAEQRGSLEAELAELEGPRRKAAVQAIKTAREFGDLSEIFEYHAAKSEQGLLEARIRALRDRLSHAVTVEHDTDEHVGVGSIVGIADADGDEMEVEISAVGGVSPDSPLGAALMGAVVGDVVQVEAPSGSWKARVLAIRRG